MTVLIFLGGMAVGSVFTLLVTTVVSLTRANRQLQKQREKEEEEEEEEEDAK